MRITLKKYEQAKKAVEEAKAHLKTIKVWEEALKKLGNLGNQRVVAITFKDDQIKTECELDETAGKPILQAEKGAEK